MRIQQCYHMLNGRLGVDEWAELEWKYGRNECPE